MKKDLPTVTLLGVDCYNLERSKIAMDICQKHFSFGAVKLLSSIPDDDPRVVPIPPMIKSTEDFSYFAIKEMWKYIDTEHVLFFQHDGFILNPAAWDDEFLKYDHIGAPWYHMGNIHVGNGGLSIRSKRLFDLIGKNWQKIGGVMHPEDNWICEYARDFLEKEGIKFAPLELASRFSKEGNQRSVVWNGEFGFHGLTYTDISKWLEQNPEYKDIFKQKLDDFTRFMQKYPIYDGTVHVLRSKPLQVETYKKLAKGEKDYDCRIDSDLLELDPVKSGHKIVYRLFRISLAKVGVPTFERKVLKVEKFTSKKDLLEKNRGVEITPSFNIPRWRQNLAKIFGNMIYPKNYSYTIFWFEKK